MAINISVVLLIFIVIASSIFGIASSSIAIQAYNENPNYNPYDNPTMRKNNFIYLWVNIGLSILALFTAIFVFQLGGARCPDAPSFGRQ
jgi:heme/copper-type cytochrome/quinol oxidase subunit 2